MRQLPARNSNGDPEPTSVVAAVAALRAGLLVIVPTDTVYGIAAQATNPAAVTRLFQAKQRSSDKPVALLAASAEQAAGVIALDSPLAERLVKRWWPGPLTVVGRALVSLPDGIGVAGTVGVRVPADPVVQAIAEALEQPLAVSSANRSGAEATATFAAAVREVGAAAAVALDGGDCPSGVASTVVDLTGAAARILRQGEATIDLEA